MLRLVIAALLFASWAHADTTYTWVYVGADDMGSNTNYYTRPDQIKDLGGGIFLAPTLMVHEVTIIGIEMPGPDGEMWLDTGRPYKSEMTWDYYDCNRRMIANAENHYFSGNIPSNETMVYVEKDGDPIFLPEVLTEPVMEFICR